MNKKKREREKEEQEEANPLPYNSLLSSSHVEK
jgi:hypothetical protein